MRSGGEGRGRQGKGEERGKGMVGEGRVKGREGRREGKGEGNPRGIIFRGWRGAGIISFGSRNK